MIKKKNWFNKIDEKCTIFLDALLKPLEWIINILFCFLHFIFISNKYSKIYWAKRREWNKTKRRLCLRAQKEIMLSTIIPTLREQGYDKLPSSSWGWDRELQGYCFLMARLKDNEIQFLTIENRYRHKCFFLFWEAVLLPPEIKNLSDLCNYNRSPYPALYEIPCDSGPKCRKRYKLKSFKSEKSLEKKIKKCEKQLAANLSDIDSLTARWYDINTIKMLQIDNQDKHNLSRD